MRARIKLDAFRTGLKDSYLSLRRPVLKLCQRSPASLEESHNVESVLVISQRRLGDVALEIPSLYALRCAHPKAVLGLVAPAPFHPLLQAACRPDFLFDYPTNLFSVGAVGAAIRKHRWQIAIDLTTDYHLAPALLAAASRARIRIGFEDAGRGRLFDIAIAPDETEHMLYRFRRPMEALGIEWQNPPRPDVPAIPVDVPAKQPGQRRIGLHPGATHWTQRWPPEYFAALARKIEEGGDQCLVLGLQSEWKLANEIAARSGGAAIPQQISHNILSLVSVLRSLDLLICNNSGPLHLADLLQVPTLSFMGPTVKERWWPVDAKAQVLRRDDLPCIGCNKGYCRVGTHACMREITPEMAFEAFRACYPKSNGE